MPDQLTVTEAFRLAFDAARQGPAHGPNPRVGCVLLSDDGALLATGFHRGAGTPHAEADAIANARAAGVDLSGATAVVTLEPCNHTGRTGPCSEALVEAGIGRVVFAVADPNPRATGGAERLRAASIDVAGPGDLDEAIEAEGRELLRVWLTSVERGRPFVTLKIASTLDGRIAAADGSSRWITSAESRAHAHALRAEVDAIAVGTGTALIDDPTLTARHEDGTLAEHQPLRVVVGHRPVPEGARLRGPGGELVHVPTHDPAEVLATLHAREVRHLLVEGGPTLTAAFLRAGLVDELHAYVAPVLVGAGKSAVGDLGITSIDGALRWRPREMHRLGPDTLVIATPDTHTTSDNPEES
ncbi:MAG: bifunctional diaminohydroxyphosphoribosylaminopyrimidine deaminase/5-amino-6-(5-phosphoribosylamino)uracil reductase RibD [Actinomycetales bacterium]|nr:bifunctional diaminohydroxyphosphoribosylaminopyrimidine deaminase/5-amino-6-(5-phosphoribosylamino)uracil reductase RibD [Actinomycetales bacterium]